MRCGQLTIEGINQWGVITLQSVVAQHGKCEVHDLKNLRKI